MPETRSHCFSIITFVAIVAVSWFSSDATGQSSSRGSSSRGGGARLAPRSAPGFQGRSAVAGRARPRAAPPQQQATGLLNSAPRPSRSSGSGSRSSYSAASRSTSFSGGTGNYGPSSSRSATGSTHSRVRHAPLSTRAGNRPTRRAMAGQEQSAASTLPTHTAFRDIRTWTDRTGIHKTQGKLLIVRQETVWLRKDDGGLAKFPLSALSEADQQYIRSTNVLQ